MDHQYLQLGANISWTLFLFAVGACVGSLTNVLVYRLPLGLGVVTQGSRCPACGTALTWRENIPVLGWIFLRGRCRFCKTPISPEYPMVEFLVGAIFAAVFVLWYWVPSGFGGPQAHVWLGIDWARAAPEWALSDRFDAFPRTTWAPLAVMLVLLGSLVAMTLVDAKTFTIPLQIPWCATIVGIVVHTVGAAMVGPLRSAAPGTGWSIPTPPTLLSPTGTLAGSGATWFQIGGSLGAMLGLGAGILLLHFKLIRRSFDDYPAWEASQMAAMDAKRRERDPSDCCLAEAEAESQMSLMPGATIDPASQAAGPVSAEAAQGGWRVFRFVVIWLGVLLALTAVGALAGPALGLKPWAGLLAGTVIGPMVAAALGRRTPSDQSAPETDAQSAPEMWIQYPHARREMLKELVFLTPCLGLGWLGGIVASGLSPATPPFWLVVLSGTLLGYLIGGGLVWLVRIGGSLAFGKEAMGLGDVHLMAAVGACTGWMDAALAFPLAAFVGLYWVVVSRIATGATGRAMPFGPYLAMATALVILGKPLVELGLNAVMATPVDMPGVNLP